MFCEYCNCVEFNGLSTHKDNIFTGRTSRNILAVEAMVHYHGQLGLEDYTITWEMAPTKGINLNNLSFKGTVEFQHWDYITHVPS